jgi:hypothetical protein
VRGSVPWVGRASGMNAQDPLAGSIEAHSGASAHSHASGPLVKSWEISYTECAAVPR